MAAYAGPPEAQQVLANGRRYGHRFTDTKWVILSLAYGPEKLSDYRIARSTDLGDARNVRRARLDAEQICWELIREYKPTCKKRDRIRNGNARKEKLTSEEQQILRKHDRPKQGRKDAAPGFRGLSPAAEPRRLPKRDPEDIGQTGLSREAQAEWDERKLITRLG